MRIAERAVTIQIRGLVLEIEGGPAGHGDKWSLLIGTHPSADVAAPVIIQDLVARAIHARSLRPDRPFNTEGAPTRSGRSRR